MRNNLELVRRAYDAFAEGDGAAVVRLFDEGIEWFEAEGNPWWTGAPFVGVRAIVDGVFARVGRELEGFTIEMRRMVQSGDTVLVEGRYHGSARATGKAIDCQMAHVWDLRDGKIVRFQQYADTRQMAEVLGVPYRAG